MHSHGGRVTLRCTIKALEFDKYLQLNDLGYSFLVLGCRYFNTAINGIQTHLFDLSCCFVSQVKLLHIHLERFSLLQLWQLRLQLLVQPLRKGFHAVRVPHLTFQKSGFLLAFLYTVCFYTNFCNFCPNLLGKCKLLPRLTFWKQTSPLIKTSPARGQAQRGPTRPIVPSQRSHRRKPVMPGPNKSNSDTAADSPEMGATGSLRSQNLGQKPAAGI